MNPETNNSDEYKSVSLKELWKITKWAFILLYNISPGHASLYFSISLINNIFDLINAYIFGKVLDVVIKLATTSNARIEQLYPYLAIMLGYSFIRSLFSFVYRYTSYSLRTYARFKTTKLLYDKIQTLQMQSLEQPDVTNRLHRASTHLDDLLDYFYETNILISGIVSLIVSSIIVINTIPFLIPLLIFISVPRFIMDKKYRKLVYKFTFENTEVVRKNYETSSDLSTPNVLQEIFINGAYKFLDDKYVAFSDWYSGTRIKLQKSWMSRSYFTLFLGDLGTMFANILVFTKLIARKITVGDSTFQIRIISSVKDSLFNIVVNINDLSEMAIRIKDTYDLFHMVPAFPDGHVIIPKLHEGPSINFKDVKFIYPRTNKKVIDGINLNIKKGEKIAIVGHNGAGKTTLVRLLCRMYQVTEGEILINGANINDLKIDDWYKNMGVLFQDFVTYPQLTVRENILIGSPNDKIDEDKVIKSANSADALGFIDQYPNKFDQTLSERYKGGIKPSTGQWQKIAIARFFYRNAPLVIFDEPTASIDAISEYNIFNRIYDFFKDKTVIIISHRFSTVRNADRIVMMENGKIAEEGTHEELMKLNGIYAKSFLLQAEGYTIY